MIKKSMINNKVLLIPLFVTAAALASCGGGGEGEAVTEPADDVAATVEDTAADAAAATESAADSATEMASDTADAVADTAGAMGDSIDPAAWQEIEMNWDSQIASVQEAFPDLSTEEIAATEGKPDNLVSLVEQKYEITRDEAQVRVSEWANSL